MKKILLLCIFFLVVFGLVLASTISTSFIYPPNATTVNGTQLFKLDVIASDSIANVSFRFENLTWNGSWYLGHNITNDIDLWRWSALSNSEVIYAYKAYDFLSDSGDDYLVNLGNATHKGIVRAFWHNLTLAWEWISPVSYSGGMDSLRVCDVNSSNVGDEVLIASSEYGAHPDYYNLFVLTDSGDNIWNASTYGFSARDITCAYNNSNGIIIAGDGGGFLKYYDGVSGTSLISPIDTGGGILEDCIQTGNFTDGHSNDQIAVGSAWLIGIYDVIDGSLIDSDNVAYGSVITQIIVTQLDDDAYDEFVVLTSYVVYGVDNDLTNLWNYTQPEGLLMRSIQVSDIDSLSLGDEIIVGISTPITSHPFIDILNKTGSRILKIEKEDYPIHGSRYLIVSDVWGSSDKEIISSIYGTWQHNTSIINLTYEPSLVIDPTFLNDEEWYTVRGRSSDTTGNYSDDTIMIFTDYNYSLNIISPTSTSQAQLSDTERNLTSTFDLLYGDTDITSGVNVMEVTIGGLPCNNITYSYVISSWQLNCTAPTGLVEDQDLFIKANYTFDGSTTVNDTEEDAVYYVAYTITEGNPIHDPIIFDREVQWRREYTLQNFGGVNFYNITITGNFWNVSYNITIYDQYGLEVSPYQDNQSGGWLNWIVPVLSPYQVITYTLTYVTDPVSIQNRVDYYDGSYWNATFDVVGVQDVPYEDINIVIDAFDFLENIKVYESTNGDIDVTTNPMWYVDYIDYDGDLIDESVSFQMPYLNGNRSMFMEADRIVPVTWTYDEFQSYVEVGTEQFVEWRREYNFTSTASTTVVLSPKLTIPTEASRIVFNDTQALANLWRADTGTYVQPTFYVPTTGLIVNLTYFSPPVISFIKKIEPEIYRTDDDADIVVEIDILNTGDKSVYNITKEIAIAIANDASLYLDGVFIQRIGNIYGSYTLEINYLEASGERHYEIKYKLPTASVEKPFGVRQEIFEGDNYDVYTYIVRSIAPITLSPLYLVAGDTKYESIRRVIVVADWTDQIGTGITWYEEDNSTDVLFKIGALGSGDFVYVKVYKLLERFDGEVITPDVGSITGAFVAGAGDLWNSIVGFFTGVSTFFGELLYSVVQTIGEVFGVA